MSSQKLRGRFLERLLPAAADRERFVAALDGSTDRSVALIWTRDRPPDIPFSLLPALGWQPEFVDLVDSAHRPGGNPLHKEGAYYCLDPSSVFAVVPLLATNPEKRINSLLDLCASPGGKAVCAARGLKPTDLVANEPVRKRIGALISNLSRCAVSGSSVTQYDPAALAELAPAAFDCVIVDAPCSGQSLLFRGKSVPGCFHERTIERNANRQRRIIANGAKCVAPGGYLAYMTCTFSREENEEIAAWLVDRFPSFEPVQIPILEPHRSPYSASPCYRLWPWEGRGAGAFTILFRNGPPSLEKAEMPAALKRRWRTGEERPETPSEKSFGKRWQEGNSRKGRRIKRTL
jgi:16S rRNA C967 or C1407 C5-methylase (RsmB/RsmF family)